MPTQDLGIELRRLLLRASGQQLTRSEALRKLHTTAAELDKVVESLALEDEIEIETALPKTTRGRPGLIYKLPKKSVDSSRLQAIGKLIDAAVQLALGGAK